MRPEQQQLFKMAILKECHGGERPPPRSISETLYACRPPPTPPTATPVVHHHHHQLHQSMPHPMAAGPGRHYPMHSASGSPSPHLSHASQMSHMQHLAQMPRASSAGPMGHLGHNIGHLSGAGGAPSSLPKQDPNPFEREWRI